MFISVISCYKQATVCWLRALLGPLTSALRCVGWGHSCGCSLLRAWLGPECLRGLHFHNWPLVWLLVGGLGSSCGLSASSVLDQLLHSMVLGSQGINVEAESIVRSRLWNPQMSLLPFSISQSKSQGHYAKGNKPDTEIQILHDLTYMWTLK